MAIRHYIIVAQIDPGTAMLGSTALSMLGGGLSSALQSSSSARNMKRQYRYQMRSLLHGPSVQVEGLKRAGLNPMLAVTGGGIGQAQQMGLPQAGMPNIPTPDLASSAKDLSQAGLSEESALTEIERQHKIRKEQGLITKQEEAAVQMIKRISNEARYFWEKGSLTTQEMKLVEQKTAQIEAQLKKLQEISKVYDGPAGALIAYINAIIGTINMGVSK